MTFEIEFLIQIVVVTVVYLFEYVDELGSGLFHA